MLPKEKEMEVLEVFDLTKSYRAPVNWSESITTRWLERWPLGALGQSERRAACAAEGGRGVRRQDRRVDRAFGRPSPR